MSHRLLQLLLRWAVMSLGVIIATKLIPGIQCEDSSTLIVVVLLLSLFNAILRPLLLIVTLPFILVTLGLWIFVINALLFYMVGRLVDGFHVAGFMSALGGSLIVSITNLLLGPLTRRWAATIPRNNLPPPPRPGNSPKPPRKSGGDDDVVDI